MKKILSSKKLEKLPPYLFSKINKLKLEAYKKNLDVIDLSMGNPDIPPDKEIIKRLCETVLEHPKTHRYPQAKGMPKFRNTVAEWFLKRFGVKLDPEKEVLALIGSKEGVGHLCMAFLNSKDYTLIPDPSYPVYYNATILAGGIPYLFKILPENGYLPDFGKIPQRIIEKAKILFLNYPNNPTTAVVEDESFLKDAIKFAKKNNLILCYDNAYSEITFDGYVAPSILQFEGAKDIAVEFHSFSKTFCMAGWRVGFVVGNEYIISQLEKFKSFIDYGVPTFIQLSAVKALLDYDRIVPEIKKLYQTRRDIMIKEFKKIGWVIEPPKGSMYLWCKLPEKITKEVGSLKFAEKLLVETGVAVAPGEGFGPNGEGYIRLALVTANNRFHDAALRFKKVFKELGVNLKIKS
ncbi:MAG: aminotransferase class I/II-fold pyridoxal phosphate-dependent enzyme [Elusimicrobiota bacterium]|nr:aminotransferase class I/II-fold pyridoxal phosphate-dependent enzyme [Endomicrobiia bacterium]MDW8164998.1 aminotransferase class I/II-fold pyridoxal phosphate-dependent enzyme [Elusimicrobiota bacterium]